MKNIFREIIFCLIFILIGLFGFIGISSAVCPDPKPLGMLYCYDFEDWTGNPVTTPGYLFGTNDAGFWTDHLASSEVVTSCSVGAQSWTPHTGTYFIMFDNYSGAYNACLGGTSYGVNPYFQIGGGIYTYGNNSDFVIEDLIHEEAGDRELFFSGWLRIDPNLYTDPNLDSVSGGAALKVIRFQLYSTEGVILYYRGGGQHNLCVAEYGGNNWDNAVDTVVAAGIDLADGNWHKISFWVRLPDVLGSGDNMHVKSWLDASDENIDTPIHDLYLPTLVTPVPKLDLVALTINYSAYYPSMRNVMAWDDISFWDGMPSADIIDIIPPAAPSGLTIN